MINNIDLIWPIQISATGNDLCMLEVEKKDTCVMSAGKTLLYNNALLYKRAKLTPVDSLFNNFTFSLLSSPLGSNTPKDSNVSKESSVSKATRRSKVSHQNTSGTMYVSAVGCSYVE